jgi:hypothetical protein
MPIEEQVKLSEEYKHEEEKENPKITQAREVAMNKAIE